MLVRALATAAMASALCLQAVPVAYADDEVDVRFTPIPGGGATVTVEAGHAGTNAGASGRGSDGSSRESGTRTCTYRGHEIDCTSALGVWSQERACFVQRVSPQPDPADPQWNGHTDGTIYQCLPPNATFSAGRGSGYWFWAPEAGQSGAPTLVDPVTLAERAVDEMDLAAPVVGMTPLTPGAPSLVGMETWLWVANADQRASGPITRTATAGPVSVTATAEVTKVVWDMGDGTRVTCRTTGTPWTEDSGTGPSPDCGHQYMTPSAGEPDGTYRVRATTHWRVDWDGAGQSGRITFTMSGARALSVTELQALVTR